MHIAAQRTCTSHASQAFAIIGNVIMDEDPWDTASADSDPWDQAATDTDPWDREDDPRVAGRQSGQSPLWVASGYEDDPWAAVPQSPVVQSQPQKRRRLQLEAASHLLAAATIKGQPTQYEQKGADPREVSLRWAKPCPRRNCRMVGCRGKALHLKTLQALCRDFWDLTSEERIHLLQVTYGDCPDAQVQYTLGETQVCFANFCAKLGCGQHTTRKYIQGRPDLRKSKLGGVDIGSQEREKKATTKVDHFFQELHQSVAESMPEDEECGRLDDPWGQDRMWSRGFLCSRTVLPTAMMLLGAVLILPGHALQSCVSAVDSLLSCSTRWPATTIHSVVPDL